MLQQLDEELWTAEQPLRFLGIEVGARMTVLRLPDDRLLLHSPISRSEELARAVDALGTVGWIVAPNRFHHLHAGEWQHALPGASLLAAPGLAEKRPDLTVSAALGTGNRPEWGGAVETALLEGFPLANEVVLFHRPSATLVASDIAFHIGGEAAPLTRLLMRLGGGYGKVATTLLERLGIRDRAAYRRSLEHVLAWPFERLIVAHGTVLEKGGREALARAYDWLPRVS